MGRMREISNRFKGVPTTGHPMYHGPPLPPPQQQFLDSGDFGHGKKAGKLGSWFCKWTMGY